MNWWLLLVLVGTAVCVPSRQKRQYSANLPKDPHAEVDPLHTQSQQEPYNPVGQDPHQPQDPHAPAPHVEDPYAASVQAQDPHQPQDPYAPAPHVEDPYAASVQPQEPYAAGAQPQEPHPAETQPQEPYSAGAQPQEPYAPEAHPEDPYGTGGQVQGGTDTYGPPCDPINCVRWWLCSPDNVIISDGAGLLDVRNLGPGYGATQDNQKIGGNCEHPFDVCCTHPSNTSILPTPEPYVSSCGNTRGKAHGKEEPDQYDLNVRIHLDKNRHEVDNIAQFGAYPWMAAVLRYEDTDEYGKPLENPLNIYNCGGSLIHPRVVLTAAHCVDTIPYNKLKIRLGEWDTQTEDHYQDHYYYTHEDHFVSKVIIHKKYQAKNLYNDIALVFLQTEAKLDFHIEPVCLPPPDYVFESQYHTECYATGWGKSHYGKNGTWQAILKEVDLPIVDRRYCQSRLKGTKAGCYFCLHDTFLCAGGVEGKDTCEGDGGGPLVCYYEPKFPDGTPNIDAGTYVQAGIVAFGIGCGTDIPAGYVNVARYVRWITDNVNTELKEDVPYFQYDWTTPYHDEPDVEWQECRRNFYNEEYNQFGPNNNCTAWLKDKLTIRTRVRPRPGAGIRRRPRPGGNRRPAPHRPSGYGAVP